MIEYDSDDCLNCGVCPDCIQRSIDAVPDIWEGSYWRRKSDGKFFEIRYEDPETGEVRMTKHRWEWVASSYIREAFDPVDEEDVTEISDEF